MNKEKFSLTFFITRPFFFGIIYSQMFSLSGSDSLIACFLGTIIGLLIIYAISKINCSSNLYKIHQLVFCIFLLVLSISSIETYVSSFLFIKTPKIIIITPAILLVGYASLKDIKTIRKSSFIFLIISIISSLIIMILLGNYLNIQNLLPFLVHKSNNILSSSLIFAVMSATPNLLLKEEQIPLKKHLKYYLIICLFNTLIAFLTLAILTPDVASIYSYPEYMVLKRIKILEFIENIENLSVLIWYFDYFFLLVFIFKKLLLIIKKRVAFWTIIILTTLLTTIKIANDFYYTMWIYQYSPIIMLLFLILFLIISIISNVKHK